MTEDVSKVLERIEGASIIPKDEGGTSRSQTLERNKKLLKDTDEKLAEEIENGAPTIRDLISVKDSATKQIAILEGDATDLTGPKVIPANIVINVVGQVVNN